jgi:hypothetical protein
VVKCLSDFDVFKEDDVYKWNVVFFYNQMTFKMDVNKINEYKQMIASSKK